jgi:uncharacterized protein YggL (DUF469 family)
VSAPCPLFGVAVHAELSHDADAGSLLERFDALLSSRGLVSSGGGRATWDLVVSSEAGQMTEGDRSAIVEWLAAEPALDRVMVTPLGDLRGG